jgi:hypothetical protein
MENFNPSNNLKRFIVFILSLGIAGSVLAQDKIDQIAQTGVQRGTEAKTSQTRVDKTALDTDKIISNFKRELKVIDGLKVYNALLQRQLDDQILDMGRLRTSIDDVAVIERQIVPTMINMLESLNEFIKRDVPFLIDERNDRVSRLRAAVESSDITNAEKFRAILEAYQIEGDYGRTIEAYTGTLNIDGVSREVSFLKVGRISLTYQTADRLSNGVWDQSKRTWLTLEDEAYRNHLAKGISIAKDQIAPDMLIIPLIASEVK